MTQSHGYWGFRGMVIVLHVKDLFKKLTLLFSYKKNKIDSLTENKFLEELCILLRHVGCRDQDLPNDKKATEYILKVQQISKLLEIKNINPIRRLKLLTKETNWLMEDLYHDCINYPKVIPYVKLLNGQPRIEIIRQEQEQRKLVQEQKYKEFLDTTAKDLIAIINKYIIDQTKKDELLRLLNNGYYRHLAVELDNIKESVDKEEETIINHFFADIF